MTFLLLDAALPGTTPVSGSIMVATAASGAALGFVAGRLLGGLKWRVPLACAGALLGFFAGALVGNGL